MGSRMSVFQKLACALGAHCWEYQGRHLCACWFCEQERPHQWRGCQCTRCKLTRDSEHDWSACKCVQCGKIRDLEHDWVGCTCAHCGELRNVEHRFKGFYCGLCNTNRCDHKGERKYHTEFSDVEVETCLECGAEVWSSAGAHRTGFDREKRIERAKRAKLGPGPPAFSVEGSDSQKKALVQDAIRKYGLSLDRDFACYWVEVIRDGRVFDENPKQRCIVGADGGEILTAGGRQSTHFVLPGDYDKALEAIGKFFHKI